jgi:hypothetical protein
MDGVVVFPCRRLVGEVVAPPAVKAHEVEAYVAERDRCQHRRELLGEADGQQAFQVRMIPSQAI